MNEFDDFWNSFCESDAVRIIKAPTGAGKALFAHRHPRDLLAVAYRVTGGDGRIIVEGGSGWSFDDKRLVSAIGTADADFSRRSTAEQATARAQALQELVEFYPEARSSLH